MELALALLVAGSALAIGAVHPWAYEPLWLGSAVGLALVGTRAALVSSLRPILGRKRFAFHRSGRFIVLDPAPDDESVGWGFDLGAPVFPRGPLLWPGLAFVGWVLVQLVPWGAAGATMTISQSDTARGLAFVLCAVALHQLAAAALAGHAARWRFRKLVVGLGLALAVVGLAQLAWGTQRVYWVFEPLEGGGTAPFGPFVNRNNFAGYMLLVIPLALAVLTRALHRFGRHGGERPDARRRLLALQSPDGVALLYAFLPPIVCIGALFATTTRGAILAFVAALALAGLGLRSGRGVPAWAMALAFVAVTVSWFGLERLEVRFVRTAEDAPGRTVVWQDALARMDGMWLTGSGFNTFSTAMSRVAAWRLPEGASPWPAAAQAALESGGRVGYRTAAELKGLGWYREAHNDYVQVLVETGVPGLLIALWAAVAALEAARSRPWQLAALTGLLLHELVEFDLQIPAIMVLFVAVAALRRPSGASA
jgi:O-antigen ligase